MNNPCRVAICLANGGCIGDRIRMRSCEKLHDKHGSVTQNCFTSALENLHLAALDVNLYYTYVVEPETIKCAQIDHEGHCLGMLRAGMFYIASQVHDDSLF